MVQAQYAASGRAKPPFEREVRDRATGQLLCLVNGDRALKQALESHGFTLTAARHDRERESRGLAVVR